VHTAPALDHALYPRAYRVSRGYFAFLGVLGGLVTVAGSLGAWYFGTGHESNSPEDAAILASLCCAFVLLGAYLLASLLRFQVILRADAIVVQGVFTSRILLRADIAGHRVLPTQYVSTLVLTPKTTGQKKLKVGLMLRTDAAFKAWLAGIPNLDSRELAESRKSLSLDPELGSRSEERARTVARSKKFSTRLNVAAFLAFFWGIFFPRPYLLVITTLAALPVIALTLLVRSRGIYQVEGRRTDARPSLAVVLIFPGIALALRAALDSELLQWLPILSISVLLAFALTLVIAKADPGTRNRPAALVAFLMFAAFYAYGLIAEANSVLDNSSPKTFPVAVLGKHISRGRTTFYYLHLDPWGPQTGATEVSVPAPLYNSAATGGSVCVYLHHGALRIPWYVVASCS
jgi:hypothetical protein